MKDVEDIVIFNEQEIEEWDILQKFDETKPFPGAVIKPLQDDDPRLVKVVNDAKQKFISNYIQAKMAEMEANKEKYQLYKNARTLLEKVSEYEKIIGNYDENLADAQKEGKNKVDFVKAQYKEALSLRKQVKASDIDEAKSIVNIYDFQIGSIAKEAEEKSQTIAAETKKNYLKTREEQILAQARKNYEDTVKVHVEAREEIEKKNTQVWYSYLRNARPAGLRIFNDDMTVAEKQLYNINLKNVISNVKNAPLSDIFRLDAFSKRYPYSFNISELSDRDLRDAEQVFDRMFMDVTVFYNSFGSNEGILEKMKFRKMDPLFADLNEQDIKALGPDVRIYDVSDALLKKAGINSKELEGEKSRQYAKALFLYAVGHQSITFDFVPGYFANTEKGLELKDSDNKADYNISSDKIILNEKAEEREEYADRNQIKGERYKRLRYDEMQAVYTQKKALLITEVPVKEVPEVEEVKVQPENLGEQEQKHEEVHEEIHEEIQPTRLPNFSDEYINQKVDEFLEDHPGEINLSTLEYFIQGINHLGNNYPVFEEQNLLAFAGYGLAQAAAANVAALNVRNYPGGSRFKYTSDENIKRAYVKAFIMAKEMDSCFESYSELLVQNGKDDQINKNILSIIRDQYDLMNRDDYENLLATDTAYNASYEGLLATFPYNSFKQNDGNFKDDIDRYTDMMDRIPFFSNIQERQKYLSTEYASYREKRINNELDMDDIKTYRNEYIEYLENVKKNYNTIKGIDINDQDVRSMKAFEASFDHTFILTWQGARGADIVLKRVNAQLSALDRGWPVEDTGFVDEMYRLEKDLLDWTEGLQNITPQQQNKAKKLLQKIEEPLKRLKYGVVTSPEVREEILEALNRPIQEYVQLREEVPLAVTVPYGTPAIKQMYKATRLREVNPAEIGVTDQRIIVENEVKKPALSLDVIRGNIGVMLDELHKVEIMKGSEEFRLMKNSLTHLKEIADERLADLDPGKPYDEAMLEALRSIKGELEDTTKKTKDYLNHKAEDFAKDSGRRERGIKQSDEQNRIRMAINQLEDLNFITEMIESYEEALSPQKKYEEKRLAEDKQAAKARIRTKILEENQKIAEAENVDDYLQAIGRIIIYSLQDRDSFYKPLHGEKFEQFKNRVERAGEKTPTRKEIQAMIDTDPAFRDFMKKQSEEFGLLDQPGHKRIIWQLAIATYSNEKIKHNKNGHNKDANLEDVRGVQKESTHKQNKKEINRYRAGLISNKKRRQSEEKQSRKRTERQNEEAALNRKL